MADHAGEEVRMVPAALCHRDFSLFWGGVVLSAVGGQFTTVAMAWQMYELTNSAWQIGLLGLARAVPQIALAVAGTLETPARRYFPISPPGPLVPAPFPATPRTGV